MTLFVYKVIPTPNQALPSRRNKGAAQCFSDQIQRTINELASTGWEYIRSEELPFIRRIGLFRRKQETSQNIMIFRMPTGQIKKNQTSDSFTEKDIEPFLLHKKQMEHDNIPGARIEPSPSAAPKITTKTP